MLPQWVDPSLSFSGSEHGAPAAARRATGSWPFLFLQSLQWLRRHVVSFIFLLTLLLPASGAWAQNSAQFLSQSVPTTMTAGQGYPVSLTFQNTSANTWTAGSTFKLGPQNPQENATWGVFRVSLPSTVLPGGTVTFNFTVYSPGVSGTYNFQWRMLQEGVEWFGDFSANVAVTVTGGGSGPSRASAFVSQSVPSTMIAGQAYPVSVTFRNTGTNTWTGGVGYRLGSQNPQDSTTWGRTRVFLPGPVTPGQTATFSFYAIAPAAPDRYNFQWAMLQEGVQWFGDVSAPVAVTVNPHADGTVQLVSLFDAFNLDGMSFDTNGGDGHLDGGEFNYSATLLPDAIRLNNVDYPLGPKADGISNVVQAIGQQLVVPGGMYSTLNFLGAACNADQTGVFRLTYADATFADVSLSLTDWLQPAAHGETTALTLASRNSAAGPQATTNHVFAYTLPVNAAKTLQSITLPDNFDIKILAMGLVRAGASPIPAVPTNLVATPGDNQMTLRWNPSAGAVSYKIYRGTSPGGENPAPIAVGVTSPVYMDTGLVNGTPYYYKVRGVNGSYSSLLSPEATVLPATPRSLVNDTNNQISYTGTWTHSANRGFGDYLDDVTYTAQDNASVSYTFTGTGIDWITERNFDESNVDIYVDGVFRQTVWAYSATRTAQETLYSVRGLPLGSHTLQLVKQPGQYNLLVDAFRVYSAGVNLSYLSDLAWISASNGHGPVERDRSNGDLAGGDGQILTLNGKTYFKGLGVHSASEVVYALNGQYATFLADVGVDDEVGDNGSVTFQIWADNVKLYDSGPVRGNSKAQPVQVDVSGKQQLRLVVTDAGDGGAYDHADWADARLLSASPSYLRLSTGQSGVSVADQSANGTSAPAVVVAPHPFYGDIGASWVAPAQQAETGYAAPAAPNHDFRFALPFTLLRAGTYSINGQMLADDEIVSAYVDTPAQPLNVSPAASGSAINFNGTVSGSPVAHTLYVVVHNGSVIGYNPVALALNATVQDVQEEIRGTGTGLKADYFSQTELSPFVFNRIDSFLDFYWYPGSPDPRIGNEWFSTRWTGQIQPRYSETYTFHFTIDDGARFWLNGELLLDEWGLHAPHERTITVPMIAGQKYCLKLEYQQGPGGFSILGMEWESASQRREIVPQSQLYPEDCTEAVAGLLSLSVSPESVLGGNSSTGTVLLDRGAPAGGALVALSSNNAAAQVPASITIAAGQSSATFPVTTSVVQSSTAATLSGSYGGQSRTAPLTINPAALPTLTGLSVSPATVTGGTSSTGTVTLSGAAPSGPTGGLTVMLSSNQGAASPPTSVSIPAGASSATFPVTTTPVSSQTTASLTGTLNGVSRSATLTITAPQLTNLSVSPSTVTGGQGSVGTVTLSSAAPTGGMSIGLSSNQGAATVPATVTVAAGATSATFTVTTSAVQTETIATLTASLNGVTRTATLTIAPAIVCTPATVQSVELSSDGQTFSASLSATGGQSLTGRVTLSGAALPGGQVIALTSSNAAAFLPASVLVPAGATSVTFPFTTSIIAGTYSQIESVTLSLSAAYHNAAAVSANLTLTSPIHDYRDYYNFQAGLTPAAIAAGYKISIFATGFRSGTGIGPLGIGFSPSGGVLVADFIGYATYRFPTAADGQLAPAVSTVSNGAFGYVNAGNTLYASQLNNGSIAEINADGTVKQTVIDGLYGPEGIAFNAVSGHLFVAAADAIYEVDPATKTRSAFVSVGADGLAISADGRFLFAALGNAGQVNGYDTATGAQVFSVTLNSVPDGLALGSGSLAGLLFVNTTGGHLFAVDLATGVQTLLVDGGTRGDFVAAAPDGTLLFTQTNSVLRLIPPPGGRFGDGSSTIHTRDDLPHQIWTTDDLPHNRPLTSVYTALGLSNGQASADSKEPAAFDTRGADGTVLAARMERRGRFSRSGNAHFDLQWGLRSADSVGPVSLGPLQADAHTLPSAYDYGLSGSDGSAWSVPISFLPDLALNQIYRVSLTDVLSSLCGTYTLADVPHQSWPQAKNILTFVTAAPYAPQIPAGRALDITLGGTGTPLNGTWDILQGGRIVASSGDSQGWDVEADHTVFGGVTVSAPAGAAQVSGYQVRFANGYAGSGLFDVVATGLSVSGTATPVPGQRAAILRPLVLSQRVVAGGTTLTGTVTLDAPAPQGGATISLFSDNPALAAVPASVTIARDQTTATFTVTTQSVAAATSAFLSASYNGYRVARLGLLNTLGAGGAPPAPTSLQAQAGDARVTLTWNRVAEATGYTVKRSLTPGGPYMLLFVGLPQVASSPVTFVDRQVSNGTTYYYVVSAGNDFGESPNSNEASAMPLAGLVATPVLSPPGISPNNVYTGSVNVSLSDATPFATIRYTLDGSTPTEGSLLYRAPFSLQGNATVKARAFKAGSTPSGVAQGTYIVNPYYPPPPTAIACGQTLAGALQDMDAFSRIKGQGFYADTYSFTGTAGQTVTLTATSSAFDTVLYLIDANGIVIASNDDSNGSSNSQIVATLPAGGTYTVEVTSFDAGAVGPYTLSMDCLASAGVPEIAVSSGVTSVPNGGTVDFGTTPLHVPVTKTFTLTNSGTAPLVLGDSEGTGDFSLVQAPANPILPGQSTTFALRFNASVGGAGQTGAFQFRNNDADGGDGVEDPFLIHLSASADATLVAPTVQLTAPAEGATFTAPVGIPLSAHAQATNATLRLVEFFHEGVKIGQMSVSGTSGDGTLTWAKAPAGTYTLTAKVTDSNGLTGTSAPVHITVNAAPQAPTPVISPHGGAFTGSVAVTLTDSLAGASIFYTLDGQDPDGPGVPRFLYQGPFTLTDSVTVKARAYQSGYTRSEMDSAAFTITHTPPGPPPVVQITAPQDSAIEAESVPELAAPTAVRGTVSSAALASWEVAYRMSGDAASPWTRFGSGTAAVTDGLLGTLDTTLLLNGLYDVRLTAYDTAGQNAWTEITVLVKGGQKVGYFTLSYNDLTVPVAGMPITITRTYDSRDKRLGDFGIGWTLSTTNVRLQKSGPIGLNWKKTANGKQAYATKGHLVSITLPDGKAYNFAAALSPAFDFFGLRFSTVVYQPLPGTRGTLTADVNGAVELDDVDGGVVLYGLDEAGNEGAQYFDPRRFTLTLRDGRQFQVDQTNGLESVRDRSGNTLTFGPGGITSSSGRSVFFTRTNGLITRITDPKGKWLTYTNGGGDLASVQDRMGNTTTYDYDAQHLLTGIHDPRGAGYQPVRNDYNAEGRLIRTTDAHNHSITYDYSLDNPQLPANTEVVTDRLGVPTRLTYDGQGNVTATTRYLLDGNGQVVKTLTSRSEYADANDPTLKTKDIQTLDGRDIVTRFQYSPQGDLLKTTDPLGHETTYTYNGYGQPLTVQDASGKVVTTNRYDNAGNLRHTEDALGHGTDFDYNPNGTLETTTDAQGHVTQFRYFPTGDVQEVEDAQHHITAFAYDTNGNKTGQTTTRTNTLTNQVETLSTTFVYDDSDRLTQTIAPGHTASNSPFTHYNEIGKVDYTLDALGRRTDYTFDELGQLVQTHTPDGQNTFTAFDANGQRSGSKDKAGRISTSFYDSLGRQTGSQNTDGSTSSTAYDDLGRATAQQDENGHVSRSVYDDAGQKTKSVDALGHETKFEYDDVGRQTAVTDANGHRTWSEYDDAGRLTVTHYPDGSTSSTGYDELGRRISQTSQFNKTTTFGYDALGRLHTVTTPGGHTTTYEYDELGHKVSQTDANQHVTRFAYDSLGRLIRRTLPGPTGGLQYESMDYDAAGRLWHHVDFNGLTTTMVYDPVSGRLVEKRDGNNALLVSFAYNPDGSRQSATRYSGNGNVVTSWTYFPQTGRVQTATTTVAGVNVGTIEYGYDPAGNLTGRKVNGRVTTYGYDEANRLASATLSGGAVVTYGYDKVGNRKSLTRGGITTTYGYDDLNRLRTLANGSISSYTYSLRLDGKRDGVTDGNGATTYTFDGDDRLTGEDGPYGNHAYGYDDVGNRTIADGVTTGFDANDRPSGQSFDANGNQTSINGQTAAYDFENKLVSVGVNGSVASYLYDADGNRVAKSEGGQVTYYLVDTQLPYGAVVQEQGPSGTIHYDFGDDLVRMEKSGGLYYYLYDGLGSVRQVVPAGGSALTYNLDAWGNFLSTQSSGSLLLNSFLLNGQQFDSATGLYYLRARYYAPGTGRFTGQDPFGGTDEDPVSLHRYLYGSGDPVDNIDPTGEFSEGETLVASTAAVGLDSFSAGVSLLLGYSIAKTAQQLLLGYNSELARATINFEGGIALYHYTTPEGLAGILAEHMLLPDLQEGNKAAFGHGQYFTDLPPAGLLTQPEYTTALFSLPFGRNQRKVLNWLLIDLTGFPVRRQRDIFSQNIAPLRRDSVKDYGIYALNSEEPLRLTLPNELLIPGTAHVILYGNTLFNKR